MSKHFQIFGRNFWWRCPHQLSSRDAQEHGPDRGVQQDQHGGHHEHAGTDCQAGIRTISNSYYFFHQNGRSKYDW